MIPSALPPWSELELRLPDKSVLGPFSRAEVRERIYAGQLKGGELVRARNGEWVPLHTRPEFEEVLRLVGVDLDALALSHQQVKGWKKLDGTPEVEAVAPPEELRRAPPVEEEREGPDRRLIIGAVLGALLVLALLGWALSGGAG